LMGPAGAGSLAQVINAALAQRTRFAAMQEFFAPNAAAEQDIVAAAAGQPSPFLASACAGGARESIPC